uniref:Uncharacterized protein n=1 Tax=Terrapene triunguis TaxID=2587831 RepID=A0A674I8L8_9SAUR
MPSLQVHILDGSLSPPPSDTRHIPLLPQSALSIFPTSWVKINQACWKGDSLGGPLAPWHRRSYTRLDLSPSLKSCPGKRKSLVPGPAKTQESVGVNKLAAPRMKSSA